MKMSGINIKIFNSKIKQDTNLSNVFFDNLTDGTKTNVKNCIIKNNSMEDLCVRSIYFNNNM